MNTIEAINNRRAIKHFDRTHSMSIEEEKKILEATIQAPTSFNIQHWRFVILRNKQLRKNICNELASNQSQITDASLLVLFTADAKAWNKQPERYSASAPNEISVMMTGLIKEFYEGRDGLQRDEAHRSIGMAMQTMMLAALEVGYESCPMIGFDIDAVSKLVNLPKDYVLGPMVAIGKGIKGAWPKTQQISLDDLVVDDSFESSVSR